MLQILLLTSVIDTRQPKMPPTQISKGKHLIALHFSQKIVNSPLWTGKCDTKRDRSRTSCANLDSHMQTSQQNCERMLPAPRDTSQCAAILFSYTNQAKQYFGRVDSILNEILPFFAVEDEVIKGNFRHRSM